MSKQISFFISNKDTDELIHLIRSLGGITVNAEGYEITKIIDNKCFIKMHNSKLVYDSLGKERTLNQNVSEIIEFSVCSPQPSRIIDTSEVDNHFKRGGFFIIDDSEEFHRQMNEIMKNPTYIDNPNYIINGFEHGRIWYSHEYYDNNGKKNVKSEQLNSLFSYLQRYIKQNYKIAKNKFGYIGPDAYQKYRKGLFVPCSGRIIIEF